MTLDKPDAFYEGAYGNQTHFIPRSEKPWNIWPLWLIRYIFNSENYFIRVATA